jgi:hypothetical protein
MFGPLCATQPPEPGESLSLVGDVIESTLFVRDASPSMGQPNDDTNISGSFCGYVWDQYAEPLENVVISLAPTSATATTDANGYFELQPYALHYDVHLQYYSLAMADTTISIDPDGVHTAQYQLFVPVDAQNQVLPPQGSISVHPNPFNPNTEIRFQISDSRQREHATIEIFNSKGQKVRKLEMRNEGLEMKRDLSYSLTWNGTNDAGKPVASGVYYARLAVGGMHLAQTKMLLLQ